MPRSAVAITRDTCPPHTPDQVEMNRSLRAARVITFVCSGLNGMAPGLRIVRVPLVKRHTGISHATLGSLLPSGRRPRGPSDLREVRRPRGRAGPGRPCAAPRLSCRGRPTGPAHRARLCALGPGNGCLGVAMNTRAVQVEHVPGRTRPGPRCPWHPLEGAALGPPAETGARRGPRPVPLGHVPPGRPGAELPHDAVEGRPAVQPLPASRRDRKQRPDEPPLGTGRFRAAYHRTVIHQQRPFDDRAEGMG